MFHINDTNETTIREMYEALKTLTVSPLMQPREQGLVAEALNQIEAEYPSVVGAVPIAQEAEV